MRLKANWSKDPDTGQWFERPESLNRNNYDSVLQTQDSFRLWQNCLSGSLWTDMFSLPTMATGLTDYRDIYPKLNYTRPGSFYFTATPELTYVSPALPSTLPTDPVQMTTLEDLQTMLTFKDQQGLTQKNYFSPEELRESRFSELFPVDLATTTSFTDLNNIPQQTIIDGVILTEGRRVLFKDQTRLVTLLSSVDPDTIFRGKYEFESEPVPGEIRYRVWTADNGVYEYTGGSLVRLQVSQNALLLVKTGQVNKDFTFIADKMMNGIFPDPASITPTWTGSGETGDPVSFSISEPAMLRHRTDYNNLYELVLRDVVWHDTRTATVIQGTYSYQVDVPSRQVAVGEFGSVLLFQSGVVNIIKNPFKYELRSIAVADDYYWVCGDKGLLLRINIGDLAVKRIPLPGLTEDFTVINLTSLSFFGDKRGVVVGEFGGIWVTEDGGNTWSRLSYPSLGENSYRSVEFVSPDRIIVVGDNGVLLVLNRTLQGWSVVKKRVSVMIDGIDDELLLVDDITSTDFYRGPNNELILLFGTDRGELFIYDPSSFFGVTISEFIRLDFSPTPLTDALTSISYGAGVGVFLSTLAGIWNFDPTTITLVGGPTSNLATVTLTQLSSQSGIYGITTLPTTSPDTLSVVGMPTLWKQLDIPTSTLTDTDPVFLQRLRPGFLFLDYDVASKVYWYDDLGQYRLPARLNIPESFIFPTTINETSVSFIPSINPITGTQERSWFDYYADRKKTFRYYSSMDQSNVIEPEWTFSSWGATTADFQYTISTDLTTDLADVLPLMPNMTPTTEPRGTSRFRSGLTSIALPTSGHDLYFYDYLGVWKNTVPTPLSQATEEGDLLHISSDVFEGVFMVNRVLGPTGPGGTDHYCYFYTDFEQNVINDLSASTGTITVRNLNKYPRGLTSSPDIFIENFNRHWISYAWEAEKVNEPFPIGGSLTASILFTGKKTDKSVYYGIQCRAVVTDTTNTSYTEDLYYPEGFLNFGYTAEYGILSYLTFIDPVEYTPTRELYSLPRYAGIPAGIMTGEIRIDSAETDRLWLGTELLHIWESIPLWVFVDVSLDSTLSERLLVIDKYVDEDYPDTPYVIRFQAPLVSSLPGSSSGSGNFPFYPTVNTVAIGCRRTLAEIDDDLRYINNIHRPDWSQGNSYDVVNIDLNSPIGTWNNLESGHGRKYPTDSYMKAFVMDMRAMEDLSVIVYVDGNGLLSAQVMPTEEITDRDFSLTSISNSGGLYRFDLPPGQEHGLSVGDKVLLYGPGQLNYPSGLLGVHIVTATPTVTTIVIDAPFGGILTQPQIDGLRMKYVEFDPFLNYTPLDRIRIDSYNGKSAISVYLGPENSVTRTDGTKDLVSVDREKLRYRLTDGLSLNILNDRFPWFLEADVKDALVGINTSGELVWYRGTWECGRWFSGTWLSGRWVSGDWFNGRWTAKEVLDPDNTSTTNNVTFTGNSRWFGGRWFGGTWEDGTWYSGRWYAGEWKNGVWNSGIWNGGTWQSGLFRSGIWVDGVWNSGILSTDNGPSFWLAGDFNGGDFESGEWFSGVFREQNGNRSRFGTRPTRTRMAIWKNGSFLSGQFHSVLNETDGRPVVSDDHRYSLWLTGRFLSGNMYGGIVRNIEFGPATWHGGISEEVTITDMDVAANRITVQGELPWRNGDTFRIVDRDPQIITSFSAYGTLLNPTRLRVLNSVYDPGTDTTEVLVFPPLIDFSGPSGDPQGSIAVVSSFEGSRWLSGLWFNGVFKNGVFLGGSWFDGHFDGDWG